MEIVRMVAGVNRLPIDLVEDHLLRNGWTKRTTANPNAIVYEGPLWDVLGRPLTVVLPARKSQPDANRRLNEVIRTVAAVESKSPESLVEAIAKPKIRRRAVKGKAHFNIASHVRMHKQANSEV